MPTTSSAQTVPIASADKLRKRYRRERWKRRTAALAADMRRAGVSWRNIELSLHTSRHHIKKLMRQYGFRPNPPPT